MGLFDTLENVAGLGGTGGQAGSTGAPQAVIRAIIQMVQAQPDGIAGVIQKFESAGMGGAAKSWLSTGANQPVSPDQVHSALGDGPVGQVAQQLGVPPGEAAGHIAKFLPAILDHLSPAAGGLSELTGLLSRFA